MSILQQEQSSIKIWQLATIIVLLLIAFVQCFMNTHDLLWAYDYDFDRDMAFIQGTLDGKFGEDPNYANEHLWYNPLLFLTETAIVKITGLPANIVLARGGTYFNFLGPIAFCFMLWHFYKLNTVLASLTSFLFLSTGNLLGWSSATYSPWLYPASFMQFLFYINIILCYKAFTTQKYSWFLLLGISIGICFLGHTAPTVLIILILLFIQSGNIFQALKVKQYKQVQNYLLQGIVTFIPFIIASFPLLYFIIGKYNLHIVNRMAFEYFDTLFIPINFPSLLKENLSVSLFVSIVGFIGLYKNTHNIVVRKIIFNWFYISAALFAYTTFVPVVQNKYHIYLLGVVPSFHFFFYLKAIQSVFFGYGFYLIGERIIHLVSGMISRKRKRLVPIFSTDKIFLIAVVLMVIIYFPYYSTRRDFVYGRQIALERENEPDKIEVYNWIVKNIPDENVILCEHNDAIYPVMATGRKMVSTNATFSNPYLDFEKREADRNNMIAYLKSGQPESVKKLFDEYRVNAVLLKNTDHDNHKIVSQLFSQITFQNNQYTIFQKL
ncbi:MAG: hypothetical protein ABI855_02530 [Bacteroidota bacterium]